MTKPSRKDNAMPYSREEYERRWAEVMEGVIDIDGSDRDLEIILEALRIAADQMTEREKVVAWARTKAAEQHALANSCVDKDRLAYRRSARSYEQFAAEIERGDHSSAKPASGWRTMETAPRDGTRVLLAGGDLPCVRDGWFIRGEWQFGATIIRYKPEFWQPLPSPPGEGR